MSMIQSTPIEIAAKNQSRLFTVYVLVLIVGAVLAAIMTILVYRAGNRYQSAVQSDADARIVEAGSKAATANEHAAIANAEAAKANEGLAKSNEEIARLTKEAEQAKTERAEADRQIAIAKADAARAKQGIANAEAVSAKAGAEVARLQVVIANAERRRAEAEKELLELQERLQPRHLSAQQKQALIELSKGVPNKGEVGVYAFIGNNEAIGFSVEIVEALKAAGWKADHLGQHASLFGVGVILLVRDANKAPQYAGPLQGILKTAGVGGDGLTTDQVAEGKVFLFVGPKP
jgi:hypothetical protein